MPKSGKKASEKARGGTEAEPKYDFLYHDSRRIGSFLAQFDESGHLQELRQSESFAKQRTITASGSAGADIEILNAEGTLELAASREGGEALERVYDPLWTNARTFLGYLTKAGLVQEDIVQARIGQFVRASGHLAVHDLSMLKGAWRLPALKKILSPPQQQQQQIPSGLNREERKRQEALARKSTAADQKAQQEFGLEYLSLMPHAVQACLYRGELKLWCILRDECMVVPASDLMLKHGLQIAGEWHLLGILDALPELAMSDDELTREQQGPGLVSGLMTVVMLQLGPLVRHYLGRPMGAYGVTPLLIYREIYEKPSGTD